MLTFSLIFFISIFGYCQQKNILFIGNSYTYGNDLPLLVKNLAEANGHSVFVDSHSVGGATFANHASNSTVMTKIKSKNWDYVIIQGQSQEPAFPDQQVNNSSIPGAKRLTDSVYANNFCTEVMFFMTWGRKNGDPQWGPISTFEGMQQRLYDGYMRIADSCQASVAPVGQVWRSIRNSMPEVELYQSDESHPTLAGSYLAAMTIYSSVFMELPTTLVGNSGLSSQFTNQINEHIQADVLDELALYHLRMADNHTVLEDFTISQYSDIVQGIAFTRKAQNVHWAFGDGAEASGWNVQHQYSQLGNYTVTVTAQSACSNDQSTQTINVDVLAITEVKEVPFQYVDGIISVENFKSSILLNGVGQQIAIEQATYDLKLHPKGIYFLWIEGLIYRIPVF